MFSETVISAVSAIRTKATPVDLSDRSRLITNLVFLYQVIKASERLLVEAAVEATGRLKQYYISHLEEEREHEKWLAEDLLAEGIDVETVPPIRKATEMAGSQYYLIKHVNPACLLGYMAVLEGFPHPVEAVEHLKKLHGDRLTRTLHYHAIHDQDHRKELFQVIDEVAHPDILRNAIQTQIYVNELSELLANKKGR